MKLVNILQFFKNFKKFFSPLPKEEKNIPEENFFRKVEKPEMFPVFFLKETVEVYKESLEKAEGKFKELKYNSLEIQKRKGELDALYSNIELIRRKEFVSKLSDAEEELKRRFFKKEEELKGKIRKEESKILSEVLSGSVSGCAEENARQWEWRKIFQEGQQLLVAKAHERSDECDKRVLILYNLHFFMARVDTSLKSKPVVKYMTDSVSQMNNQELLTIMERSHLK